MTQPLIRILQIEEDELTLRIVTTIRENVVLDDLLDVSSGSPGLNNALIWNGSAWAPAPVGGAGVGGSTIFENPTLPFAPGHLVTYDNIPGGSPPGGSPTGFYNVNVIRLGNRNQFIVAGETATNFGSPRYSGSPQVIIAGSPANQTSLEIRANTPGLMFYDNDATGNEKSWRFVVDQGDFIGEIRSDSGKTQNRWLELTRSGVRIDDLYLYVGQQERAIHAVRGAAIELYHNNINVAETTTSAGGGFRVNNLATGGGFERVLTTSDLGTIINVGTGDGLELTTGSPILIQVDATVVRFAGSPIITGSPSRGDILYDDGSGKFVRLPVGADGQVLTVGSPTLSWKNPTGGGGGAAGSPLLDIRGGTGIDVTFGSPKVLITNTAPNVDQNLWDEFRADSGNAVASGTNEKLTVAGGAGINTSIGGSPITLTITNTAIGSPSSYIENVVGGDGITVTTGSPQVTVAVDSTVIRTTSALNDLGDVVAGSPTIGTILYNDGTNWLKLARGTNGQILTMASPLLPVWRQPQQIGNGSPVQDIRAGDGINITFGSPVATIAVDATVIRTTSALNDLGDVVAGSPTRGAILYNDGTNWLKLPIGTHGQILTVGSPAIPTWKPNQGASGGGSPLLDIRGGTGIDVTFGSPKVLITNTAPNVDQNLWLNIAADVGGPVAANTTTDTLTIAGGSRIRTNIAGDTVTVNMTGSPFTSGGAGDIGSPFLDVRGGDGITVTTGSPRLTIAVDSTVARDGDNISTFVNDAGYLKTIGSPFLDVRAGTGISVAFGSPRLTITNTAPNVDQNLWDEFRADGGNAIAAGTNEKLTIAGGNGIYTTIGGSPITLTISRVGSPAIATNVVGGDGITVTTGSPQVTVTVDGTVFRTTNNLTDIADVVAGSPTIGAVLYNDGTNWLKLARGTNGQVLTMGSPLVPIWKDQASVSGSGDSVFAGDGINIVAGSPLTNKTISVDGTVLRTTSKCCWITNSDW
jgi:hypothetical protein